MAGLTVCGCKVLSLTFPASELSSSLHLQVEEWKLEEQTHTYVAFVPVGLEIGKYYFYSLEMAIEPQTKSYF